MSEFKSICPGGEVEKRARKVNAGLSWAVLLQASLVLAAPRGKGYEEACLGSVILVRGEVRASPSVRPRQPCLSPVPRVINHPSVLVPPWQTACARVT